MTDGHNAFTHQNPADALEMYADWIESSWESAENHFENQNEYAISDGLEARYDLDEIRANFDSEVRRARLIAAFFTCATLALASGAH